MTVKLVLGLGGILAILAGGTLGPAWAQDSQGVAVLKGKPVERAEPAVPPPGTAEQGQQDPTVLMESGGRHLWMVDRTKNQITDCQSVHTVSGGQRQIDCSTQPLPPTGQ